MDTLEPFYRRTKIVCTLGPSTDNPDSLKKILLAGANVVRLNFSHGSHDEHAKRVELVRQISKEQDLNIAILADLQGPKIRIGRFANGPVKLSQGDAFTLDASIDSNAGSESQVGLDYKPLPDEVKPGDMLLLDDGRIQMEVKAVEGSAVRCTVTVGGTLSNNKGINKKGGGLSAPALTDKDKKDMKLAAQLDVDYVAVSFPRDYKDIEEAKTLLKEFGGDAGVVAKIERAETVSDPDILKQIILESDAVMVARGDLGVEIGDAELIGMQKQIIQQARHLRRVVITATQMMESMIHNPIPTRAEVFDVANAVLDGTDAVMLSAETATGDHPDKVVEAMSRACIGAEKHPVSVRSRHRIESEFTHIDESVAMATMYIANHLTNVKAIVCLTESGSTPLWMSRIRSGLPIYAVTPHAKTQRRVALYRGVQAIKYDVTDLPQDQGIPTAIKILKEKQLLKEGDLIITTFGDKTGVMGASNTMKILIVE